MIIVYPRINYRLMLACINSGFWGKVSVDYEHQIWDNTNYQIFDEFDGIQTTIIKTLEEKNDK